ncbi:MAG: hypothetical protein AB1479_09905 [Pseudomonadota bacterium]
MIDSISCNRIICNNNNAIRDAVLSAASQRGSTDIRVQAQSRSGRGRMMLSGVYTGAADSLVDVEVIAGAGTLRATQPVVAGVGNGAITVYSVAPGATPETITFTLLNAGDPADAGVLDFYGVQLAAKTAGAAGNALTLSVARNLVATPMQYALLEPIDKGVSEFSGPQYDWGGPAEVDGAIPATAPRIQFEGYPQVHRAWRRWDAGDWVYRLDPAPAYDVPAGTRLLAISGYYTLLLSDGVTSESYTAITMYDFLSAVQARSVLVEVRGVVAQDRAPGGMAITDIPLRTDAHALPVIRNIKSPLGSVTIGSVSPNAPTENITVTAQAGGQRWSVRGDVSGSLPSAVVGEPYSAGPVGFVIERINPQVGQAATITAKPTFVGREKDEGLPAICLNPLRLGAQATDKTITYTYTKRSPSTCSCEGLSVGRLSPKCLGIDTEDTIVDQNYLDRVKAVYAWRETVVRGNTAAVAAVAAVPGTPRSCTPGTADYYFNVRIHTGIQVSNGGVGSSELILVVPVPGFTSPDAAEAARAAWDGVTVVSGYALADQTITFSNGSLGAMAYTPQDASAGMSLAGLQTTVADRISSDGGSIVCTDATAGTPATKAGFIAAKTDIDWMDGAIAILLDALPDIYDHEVARAAWDALFSEVQGDMTIVLTSTGDDLGYADPRYMDRYKATVANIYLSADLLPKGSASIVAGDGCWRDDPSATHWWEPDDTDYAPAFSNAIYVSCKKGCGTAHPEGQWYSTQEFGFGLVVACDDALKEGDKITIKISGTAGASNYVEGDTFTIPLIRAQAAPFVGGEDGDPTQTWTVRGSAGGAYPDWLFNPEASTDYTDGPITASLSPGGIPFEAGDTIRVAIEGGRIRWRRDGGAWTEGDLYADHSIGDGLSLSPVVGPSPGFVSGDAWTFLAVATSGLDRVRQPRPGRAYAWDGDDATIDVDMGAVTDCDLLMIALHTLPASASLTISGGLSSASEWSASLPVQSGPIVSYEAARRARYMRIQVTGAGAGASIGWLYAGMGWTPTVGASDLTMVRQYNLRRGGGINPGALYNGRGTGGQWSWSLDHGGALEPGCADELLAAVDHVAEQGLEPVGLIADVRDPARAALAIVDVDDVTFTDWSNWQHADSRLVGVTLPFRAVYA